MKIKVHTILKWFITFKVDATYHTFGIHPSMYFYVNKHSEARRYTRQRTRIGPFEYTRITISD